MTRIITRVPQINTQSITGENTQAPVTLAGPKGWDLQIDRDRSETAPRGGPFRAHRPLHQEATQ